MEIPHIQRKKGFGQGNCRTARTLEDTGDFTPPAAEAGAPDIAGPQIYHVVSLRAPPYRGGVCGMGCRAGDLHPRHQRHPSDGSNNHAEEEFPLYPLPKLGQ
ncbi:MAG TPA: hypothetical protein VMV49_15010 [Candidatus Deferrimicrobium sp.]|nr:hypothetical protein [Candidatus Deferrimicrobium sp.]